ncbi:MAG TPA: DUF2339 domain-containing protein [Flavobacterium sp.]|jgi:uncharacterized membrane protein
MAEDNDEIDKLRRRLELLAQRQESYVKEINDLRQELTRLKFSKENAPVNEPVIHQEKPMAAETFEDKRNAALHRASLQDEKTVQADPIIQPDANLSSSKTKLDTERFIGENIISKIGIAITVIGVGIGAKYSIEHQLISPLTRIILGYLIGLGLLAIGIKLKQKYENYSAVLVSGAIAILYFITYAAHSFYDLLPQAPAFLMMTAFTIFAVITAVKYNQQVIAHIGLVGAYAVPFLLSDGSGKVGILFSYMSIINVGILAIAFNKYWKSLYYSSFLLTWLIYFAWFTTDYQSIEHFKISMVFLLIFFLTFYAIFLAYKIIKKEKFATFDVVLLLLNSFIFYGIGYAIIDGYATAAQYLGLFTFCNAILHLVVSAFVYYQRLADRNLFFLIYGLVIVFVTLSIPVQLDGNWVTLLWVFEAGLLFWIGRTRSVSFYETLSYPVMVLASLSILGDWSTGYYGYDPEEPQTKLTPLLNIHFLTSVLFTLTFAFINYINIHKSYMVTPPAKSRNTMRYLIPTIFLVALYMTFRLEISSYWHQLYIDSALLVEDENLKHSHQIWNTDMKLFATIWLINYSLLFFALMAWINIKKYRNFNFGITNIILSALTIVAFLTLGLYDLSELRESYLSHALSPHYEISASNITIRYISLIFVALTFVLLYIYRKQEFLQPSTFDYKVAFDIFFYTSLLWIASSELLMWMDFGALSQSYKLGLSILWGSYALLMIVLGIWKNKRHLRMGAMVLFAGTLIKLFLYDISHLNTIAKTIVFVSLGLLLLMISFLYNKYKAKILEETQ